MTLAQLASDDVLDSAYEWLCRRRQDYSANSDVWAFRRRWSHEKEHIRHDRKRSVCTALRRVHKLRLSPSKIHGLSWRAFCDVSIVNGAFLRSAGSWRRQTSQ
ncbi:MAG: hypothetical protein V3R34_01060, partial [Hyphomicrobium sp.]